MSNATYRITVRPEPHAAVYLFTATVYRLSDDMPMAATCGVTADEAEAKAREWIVRENTVVAEERTVLVGDDGQNAEAAL